MLRLNSNIFIGESFFDFVTNVQISSSWELFTDTATIVLPLRFKRDGETITAGNKNLFKRGDFVNIQLGYFPNLLPEFDGFVSRILADSPLTIECQDASWLLKQKNITKSFRSIDLQTLLDEITVPEVPVEATVEAELGQFRMTNVNGIQVLKEIKKTYGLPSWVRLGRLFSGLPYIPAQRTVVNIEFERNIIGSGLEFKREEDVKIKVRAISMLPNNKKIQVDVGDPDGEQRTLTYYNLTKNVLIATANRELPKLKFTGYFGTFTTFGEPSIKHGDAVNFINKKFPERDGLYLVDRVEKSFGINGYRQVINLGPKISSE